MAARYAGLTTVRQPMRELGATAARLLDELITGDRTEPRARASSPPSWSSAPARTTPTGRNRPMRRTDHAAARRSPRWPSPRASPSPPAAATQARERRPRPRARRSTTGKATGTIDVWAMGTEGEVLGDFVEDFDDGQPRRRRSRSPRSRGRPRTTRSPTPSPAGETPDVSLIGTTWMGEFAEAGGLDADPRGPRRRGRLLRGRLGLHRGRRHVVRRPVVRRDPRALLPHRPGREGRLGRGPDRPGTSCKQFADGPAGEGRRRVRPQPAARPDRLVADACCRSPGPTAPTSPTRTAPSTRSTPRR